MILFIGCSNGNTNKITFKGESSNWQAARTYTYSKDWVDDIFQLKYKDKNTKNTIVKYKLTSDTGNTTIAGEETMKEGLISHPGGGNIGIPNKEQYFILTVEWDGKTETMKLIVDKNGNE
ncbi:MAG: hypothetical protein M0T74_09165 [Desulfitobacterium hafniense]|nr:hypothetical protein [Desulfitobacterium hafniense]